MANLLSIWSEGCADACNHQPGLAPICLGHLCKHHPQRGSSRWELLESCRLLLILTDAATRTVPRLLAQFHRLGHFLGPILLPVRLSASPPQGWAGLTTGVINPAGRCNWPILIYQLSAVQGDDAGPTSGARAWPCAAPAGGPRCWQSHCHLHQSHLGGCCLPQPDTQYTHQR